jgi:DNA-binding transcriptional regulator GbsR (MarR family)
MVTKKMSEVAMPEVLDSLAKIGKEWELGELAWRVWGCILFHSCPVSQKEIEESTGYRSGLISMSLRKLKMAHMINEVNMGGDIRYSVNTSLSDAFGKFSKRFFEDNIKPVVALLAEKLDKIEDAKVKKNCCELINEGKKLDPVVLILSRVIEDINTSTIKAVEEMEERSGIGFTGTFRESMAEIKEGSKVVFTGSVAVCTPFIELLAYTVRDRGFEMVYVPRADAKEARKIRRIEKIGYSVVDEMGDPKNPDAIVVLGGLAMPKFGCPPEDVTRMIEEIAGAKKPKIIGVGFMNMFERAGWDKKIPFDTLIDTAL